MGRRNILTAILSAAGLFLLILDGKTALSGAAEGMELCIKSVIPSLFPFCVLSNLLTCSVLGYRIPFLQPVGRLFHIPKGTESLLLTGFLGGYPVGAQNIAAAWRSGQIPKEDAERMLGFCCNAGPSFLFGIIGPMFPKGYMPWLLWAVHILSALIVSLCIPDSHGSVRLIPQSRISLSQSLTNAVTVMATVCGWVILFRMAIAFLTRWFLWMVPDVGKLAVMGLLELTNGCLHLSLITNEGIRFLAASGILGFGGVCVTMQTASVTQGLSLRYYFPGKIMQASISMLLCWLFFPTGSLLPAILVPFILISAVSLRKMENRSRNLVAVGV